MTAASLQVDYTDVPFGDGSSFLLPSDFTVNSAYRGEKATRNVVRFRNCHKFGATTRIVNSTPH